MVTAARPQHQHTHATYATSDRFVAQGLYRLGTHLAPVQDAELPASRTSQDQRWHESTARHEWRFDDARAWSRAKWLRQQERALARILRGEAERDGWWWQPRSLDMLLPILMANETEQTGRTTRTDRWRPVDASEQDTEAATHTRAPFADAPVSLAKAAESGCATDDAMAVLRLHGVDSAWSDAVADAPWSAFPQRPCIAQERLGSLGEWTYRAAYEGLTPADVDDADESWDAFLFGRAAAASTRKSSEQPERVVRTPEVVPTESVFVTVAEAAALLHLTPAAIRQRIRRHHLQQMPAGRTHLVHIDDVRHAS